MKETKIFIIAIVMFIAVSIGVYFAFFSKKETSKGKKGSSENDVDNNSNDDSNDASDDNNLGSRPIISEEFWKKIPASIKIDYEGAKRDKCHFIKGKHLGTSHAPITDNVGVGYFIIADIYRQMLKDIPRSMFFNAKIDEVPIAFLDSDSARATHTGLDNYPFIHINGWLEDAIMYSEIINRLAPKLMTSLNKDEETSKKIASQILHKAVCRTSRKYNWISSSDLVKICSDEFSLNN